MSEPAIPGDVPPVLGLSPAVAWRPPVSRWRPLIGLALLVLYILVPAVIGLTRDDDEAAILPSSVVAVLVLCLWELGLFGTVFLVAARTARLGAMDLRLPWRGGWKVFPVSIGWSLALRLGVGVFLGVSLVLWQWISGASPENLAALRPHVESVVDFDALRQPLYLFVMLTLVSFVLAGLREELWRSAMIALLAGLLPRWFAGRRGAWLAILPVALLFGLGHTPQGIAGVAVTTLLGAGLGAILVFHNSIWPAVLAHGFFNALTFAVIPLLADRFPELLR